MAVRGIEGGDAIESLSFGDIDSSQTSVTASSKDIDDEVEPSFRDIDWSASYATIKGVFVRERWGY